MTMTEQTQLARQRRLRFHLAQTLTFSCKIIVLPIMARIHKSLPLRMCRQLPRQIGTRFFLHRIAPKKKNIIRAKTRQWVMIKFLIKIEYYEKKLPW